MGKTYNFQGYNKDTMVRVVGTDLTISTKKAIEVCSFIRNKHVETARVLLEDCLEFQQAIPFKRFTNGVGHRKGPMAAGAYPQKVAAAVLGLVKSLETNAQQKGFNTSNLVVVHAVANRGTTPYKMSRHRGRLTKNTHIELVAIEQKETKEDKKEKKATKPKKEEKPVEKKVEEKEVKKTEAPQVKEETKQETKTEAKEAVKEEAKEVVKEEQAEETKKEEPAAPEKTEEGKSA